MIDEVAKALKAYRSLGTLGKRLFRQEEGLQRPQQAKAKKRRVKAAPIEGILVPARRGADGNLADAGGEA